MFYVRHPWALGFAGHALSVVTFLLSIVLVVVLLRSRKAPSSMIAWLGVIAVAPYLGIPLFLMLGGRKLIRPRTRVPWVRTVRAGYTNRYEAILEGEGTLPSRNNSSIRLLSSGEEAYARLVEGIRGAKKRIEISIFIFARDEVGLSLLEELTERCQQGVQVRLLLDAWGSPIWVRPSMKKFVRAGGQVRYFMPVLHRPFRGHANSRNHRKIALFDESSAWIGGMNFAREYLGPTPVAKRWIDLAVRIEGPSARDLLRIFERDWAFAGGTEDEPRKEAPAESPTGSDPGSARAQVAGTGPDTAEDLIYDTLLEACFLARERLWIATPYFVPDEGLNKAIVLALRRGVDVRIAVPLKSNHLMADLSRGSYLRELSEAGARVAFHPRMVHAKMVLVDQDFCMVGSANFDLRSLLYNYEVGLFIYSKDELQAASRWMDHLLRECDGKVRSPKLFRELLEGFGRLFGSLL